MPFSFVKLMRSAVKANYSNNGILEVLLHQGAQLVVGVYFHSRMGFHCLVDVSWCSPGLELDLCVWRFFWTLWIVCCCTGVSVVCDRTSCLS